MVITPNSTAVNADGKTQTGNAEDGCADFNKHGHNFRTFFQLPFVGNDSQTR